MATVSDANKLDFVEGTSFLPWDWRNLGAAFRDGRPERSQSVAARAHFALRRGFDALERIDYGSVAEGVGDVGLNLRAGSLAFHLGASDLTYKAGGDAPLAGAGGGGSGGARLASLKLAAAQEFAPDQFVSLSYDLLQKKPELAVGYSGETFTERATLALHLDPVEGAACLRAGVSFAGPEWREDVLDESSGAVLPPPDDGCRHAVWVAHVARRRRPLAATRVGARLDLGRLLNFAGDFVDYRVEPSLPGLLWKVPLMPRLYNLLVPAEDENQERYRLRGLALEFDHDFDRAAPAVGLSKLVAGGAGRARVMYDPQDRAATATLRLGGLVAGAAATRAAGAGWRDWSSPSFSLSIEPLAFL